MMPKPGGGRKQQHNHRNAGCDPPTGVERRYAIQAHFNPEPPRVVYFDARLTSRGAKNLFPDHTFPLARADQTCKTSPSRATIK